MFQGPFFWLLLLPKGPRWQWGEGEGPRGRPGAASPSHWFCGLTGSPEPPALLGIGTGLGFMNSSNAKYSGTVKSQRCALWLAVWSNQGSCWGWEQRWRTACPPFPVQVGLHASHGSPLQGALRSYRLGWGHQRIKAPFLRILPHFWSGREVRVLPFPQKLPESRILPNL